MERVEAVAWLVVRGAGMAVMVAGAVKEGVTKAVATKEELREADGAAARVAVAKAEARAVSMAMVAVGALEAVGVRVEVHLDTRSGKDTQ